MERAKRAHRAWMEEQCTPYINIVPITRSPGGYRSWKTPTNFGRRTNRLSRLSSLPSLLSGILLRPPKANEKARTLSNVSPPVSAIIIYGGSREFPKRFFRDYSSEIRRFWMASRGESRESWKRMWNDRCALERSSLKLHRCCTSRKLRTSSSLHQIYPRAVERISRGRCSYNCPEESYFPTCCHGTSPLLRT